MAIRYIKHLLEGYRGMPAADLPMLAKRRGARLILINLDPTPLDHAMDVVIRADVAKALSQLARAILS